MVELTKEEYLNAVKEGARDAVCQLLGTGDYAHLFWDENPYTIRKQILEAVERGTKEAIKERA